jgi:calcineurin-like phosphoesterase family protein
MATFFTSDTHFGHANIIEYCKRPYASVEEMNQTLIERWNDRVTESDVIWHLGDFAFMKQSQIIDIVMQLRGQKFLLLGNHDEKRIGRAPHQYEGADLFEEVHTGIVEAKFEGQRIVLCHYALRVWNRSHHGAWHLYGHSHGSLPDDPHAFSMDVGVDPNGYAPVSMDQVRSHMERKRFRPVDHHTAGDEVVSRHPTSGLITGSSEGFT